ncbi:MAG: hypothetical protein M3Y78_07945 [Pseudomonadota bacterium]|nr:hypothetical protein [Pseudomonadota bacterium]
MTSDALPSSERQLAPARPLPAVWIAIAAIALVGLVLRLSAAAGDLWLDEIWSLDLVAGLTSIDQVFWRINHDNNHMLNSAWLYVTGPDVSPLVHRAVSIVLGAATVIAAAAVTADRGRPTQLAASLLFAISYPMVHYGSEARGYSGLVLFTLLSVFCLERRLDHRGGAVALAAAILFGFLSHLTMLGTVAMLVPWTAWLMLRRGDGPVRACLGTIWAFLPPFLAILPLVLCIILGARAFGFEIGSTSPFSLDALISGYGGMIRHLFGVPSRTPEWALVLLVWCLVCVSAWRCPSRRTSLYVIGIVGLPVLMAQLRLPNLEFPRYFLASGALVLLWAAEMLGRGLDAAGWRRWLAALALTAIVFGSGVSLTLFHESGRGSYAKIVDRMTREGPASYGAGNDFRIAKVVSFFARRHGRQAHRVETGDWCRKKPDWLIVEIRSEPAIPVERAPGCDLAYEHVESIRAWGLSGVGWALYRKRI